MFPFSFRKACWSQIWASRQGMGRAGLHSCLPCNECQALWSRERGYRRWQKPAVNDHPSGASREGTATLRDNPMGSTLLPVSLLMRWKSLDSRCSSWSCLNVSQYYVIPLSLNKLLHTTRNGTILFILWKINHLWLETGDQHKRLQIQT